MIRFRVLCAPEGSRGPRVGLLSTPHGQVPTPAFMPVGTLAAVKTVTPDELRAAGVHILLANSYHLYLRPGHEVIRRAGGLHRFMGWHGPILTDSGGFQVFSLAPLVRVDDDGVTFRSHLDGSLHRFTPERVVEIQEALGADIIMPLDVCTSYPVDRGEAERAVERTFRWLQRSLAVHRRSDQTLFGIVQGSVYPDLRRQAARELALLDLPGYAVGGLSVGEPEELMWPALEASLEPLPPDRPRYLMGVGSPDYLVEAVARGIDLFDCVLPTRLARHGAAYTWEGRLNLRNARFREDSDPVEPGCPCYTCARFSRAYIAHLLRAGETLGMRLLTLHNLTFMSRFMAEMRRAIQEGWFPQFRARARSAFAEGKGVLQAEC